MNILVLGAGVIGVTTAYHLARSGHRVTVIDRQPGPALETSFANGGQISATHAEPWANPRAPMLALKWLGREDAPLLYRLRAEPALWAWSLRFLSQCTTGRTLQNTANNLRLALYSRDVLSEIRHDTAIEYNALQRGILHFHQNADDFERARRHADWMSDQDCPQDVLDAHACLQREPALTPIADSLQGGVFSPLDESGDAHAFTQALAAIAETNGVEFQYGVTIHALHARGDTIHAVDSSMGELSADAYVMALGSFSPRMTRPLGLKIPVYPVKGYSVTMAIPSQVTDLAIPAAPTVSLIDDARKLVFSRLGDRLRVAGTAEFTGYDTSLNSPRIDAIRARVAELFPTLKDEATQPWAGLRPLTTDGVPVVGPTKINNLYLNTGHGTLGWTLAAGSGKVIADLIDGKKAAIDLGGISPDRFA